jgi:hypothetical protein
MQSLRIMPRTQTATAPAINPAIAFGAADRVEILLNTEELVVFHYPGKGTMIISPHVGTELTQIFTEQ